jgi:tetratricopeptide (TPR) repeat protein
MWWNSPFRTLAVIFGVAVVAGIWEYVVGTRHERDIYGDPHYNFPDAMARLYPGSAEAEYLLGRKLESESIRKSISVTGTQLTRDAQSSLKEAARHYERAINLGLKSDENLYYNYALTLVRIQSDSEKIDRAIAAWRKNFPYSTRRSLDERRRAIENQLLQGSAESSSDGVSQEIQDALKYAPEWRSSPGYVGSQACRECHVKEFESYLQTAHSKSLSEVSEVNEPAGAVFDHLLSGHRYRVEHRGGNLIHTEAMLFKDGSELSLASKSLKYRVGSGHFARTYLTDEGGGFLFESPVTWYESSHAWEMTPGFNKPNHRSFSRAVLEDCLNCHSGQVAMATTSHFRLRPLEIAIGCERCHGPGESHIAFHRHGGNIESDTIVNPQRLSRHLSEGICHQCHLRGDIQIGGRNRRAADYRPGQPLELYSTAYRSRSASGEMTVVGHVEQLKASACYRGSENLSCVTCHDPHAAIPVSNPVEHYRAICLTCHAEGGCGLDQTRRDEQAQNSCVKCHMPRSDTEVPHVSFTHHHIGLHPLKRDRGAIGDEDELVAISNLASLSQMDRNRSVMLARLQKYLQANPGYRQSSAGERMAKTLRQWLDHLPPQDDPELEYARTQFLFTTSNLTDASQAAERTLSLNGIRSEEAAVLIGQLARRDLDAGRFEQASQRYRQLVRLRSNADDWYFLGLTEERCGRRRAALEALNRATEIEPGSLEILEALVRFGGFPANASEFSEKLRKRKLWELERANSH